MIISGNAERPIPLSKCEKVQFGDYDYWMEEGCCMYGEESTKIVDGYMFVATLYDYNPSNTSKCGTCYEMVGPSGVMRFRVHNIVMVDKTNPSCSDDLVCFDLADNMTPFISIYDDRPNVTYRMVACDYPGPLKIKTSKHTQDYYFEFVVMEHTIPVKAVEIKESGTNTFIQLKRTYYNMWNFERKDVPIKYPITARIYSLTGDYVEVPNLTNEKEKVFLAPSNFPVPKDKYFDIATLNMYDKPSNAEECCSLMKDDYLSIYTDKILGAYYLWNEVNEIKLDDKTSPFKGTHCMKVNAKSWGVFIFYLNWPARADQYTHVHFAIKGENTCKNCVVVKGYEMETSGYKLNIDEANVWKEYTVALKDIGVKSEFWGVRFDYMAEEKRTFYFDDIYLVQNPNAPNDGQCWNGVVVPSKPSNSSSPSKSSSLSLSVLFFVFIILFIL